MERDKANIVNYVLHEVVARGSGEAAQLSDEPRRGNTGTSDDYGDAWFVGYNNRLTTVVWMGYPDNRRPMLGVHGVPKVNGGSLPARIWHRYISRAADVPCDYPVPDGFGAPSSNTDVEFDEESPPTSARQSTPTTAAEEPDEPDEPAPVVTSPPPTEPPQQQPPPQVSIPPSRFRPSPTSPSRGIASGPTARLGVTAGSRWALDGKEFPSWSQSSPRPPCGPARAGTPLVMVTAYDAPGARIADEAGVDIILVGDSLAMVVLGYDDTLQVTVDDMAHHVGAVARARPAAADRRRPAVDELPRVASRTRCATPAS